MSAPLLQLELSGRRSHGGLPGLVLAALGFLGLALVAVQFHSLDGQRAGLELRRDALIDQQNRSQATVAVAGLGAPNLDRTLRELATPWSLLLAELERASSDTSGNIAVLSIEPDHNKHRVRVVAEARSLELALAYVQRLRKTQLLQFPMLESHEIKSDDRDHPVRFQLSADWNDAT
jgi:hypothetical protein